MASGCDTENLDRLGLHLFTGRIYLKKPTNLSSHTYTHTQGTDGYCYYKYCQPGFMLPVAVTRKHFILQKRKICIIRGAPAGRVPADLLYIFAS